MKILPVTSLTSFSTRWLFRVCSQTEFVSQFLAAVESCWYMMRISLSWSSPSWNQFKVVLFQSAWSIPTIPTNLALGAFKLPIKTFKENILFSLIMSLALLSTIPSNNTNQNHHHHTSLFPVLKIHDHQSHHHYHYFSPVVKLWRAVICCWGMREDQDGNFDHGDRDDHHGEQVDQNNQHHHHHQPIPRL